MTKTVVETDVSAHDHDAEYHAYLNWMQETLKGRGENEPIFKVNFAGLWQVYLTSFNDPVERQYHNCHCCRRFIETYGGLVTVTDGGSLNSLFWEEGVAPTRYVRAVNSMRRAVENSQVNNLFLSTEKTWGTRQTGVWSHFAITQPPQHKERAMTAFQAAAQKIQDYRTVSWALGEYSLEQLDSALRVLESDALYRAEKVIGPVKWLRKLKANKEAVRGQRGINLIWREVALAPDGFCHPRSGMAGTLLDDLKLGLPFDEVARRFKEKMHPLKYQRPQAAPATGAIEAAERLVEKLGVASALPRRVARLDEVVAFWKPRSKAPASSSGVFGHLKADNQRLSQLNLPIQTMTWAKFSANVLGLAEKIEMLVPLSGPFSSMTTAVNADAPPVLQWDTEEKRNPVCWYFHAIPASASSFNLCQNTYVEVLAAAQSPAKWNGGSPNQSEGIFFVLDGAADKNVSSNCLFPETLKSELHGIRSVIEAYNKTRNLETVDGPQAAGLFLLDKKVWNITLRVWSNGQSQDYKIDRWD